MKTSTKIFILSSAISFLFLSVGTVLMFSSVTSGGKVTATGSAPGEMDFEGSAFQYYDIYADDSDISIEFGNFSYDPNDTRIDMCSVLGSDKVTGITGQCGEKREGQVMVGCIAIGLQDEGKAILLLEGTGDVTIVQQSVAETGGIIGLLCVGCCLGPIAALFSGLKSMKADPNQDVYLVEQTPTSTPLGIQEQHNSTHKANYPTSPDTPNAASETLDEATQKTKSTWD